MISLIIVGSFISIAIILLLEILDLIKYSHK